MNDERPPVLKKAWWRYTRWVLCIAIWALCYLLFPVLVKPFGETGAAIFGVAMIFTGWFFGTKNSLYGILIIVSFLFLLKPEDQPFIAYIARLFPGILVAAFTGMASGWVSQLLQETKKQAAELAAEKKALVDQNTLRQRAEAALQELNAELEVRVLKRTQELETANAKLNEAMGSLHTSEERLRQLSETIVDMVWLVDIKNNVTLYVSPASETILGFSPSELEQDPWRWLHTLLPEDRDRIYAEFVSRMRDAAPLDVEFRVLYQNNTIKWVSIRTFPIVGDQGEVSRIAGITKDITARKAAEEQIQSSLREKEVLLKEVHHRVKNNLQVISSLLNLAAAQIAEPESQQVFKESQNRVHSMALIHEKLYQSKDLARINFKEYIDHLARYLLSSYQRETANIRLRLDVQEIYLNIDTAIPCGLILSELVSNALKYAFPQDQNGEISVRLCQKGEKECLLEVIDTGTGVAFDHHNLPTNSLGLVLVQSLVEQLDGALSIKSHHGARFSVTFPLPVTE